MEFVIYYLLTCNVHKCCCSWIDKIDAKSLAFLCCLAMNQEQVFSAWKGKAEVFCLFSSSGWNFYYIINELGGKSEEELSWNSLFHNHPAVNLVWSVCCTFRADSRTRNTDKSFHLKTRVPHGNWKDFVLPLSCSRAKKKVSLLLIGVEGNFQEDQLK